MAVVCGGGAAPSAMVLVLACLVGTLVAQTFQYSRGWTNGKKRAQLDPETRTTRDAACQLQKLRSILEGRATPQLYWPCDWQQPPPSPLDYDSPQHGGGAAAMARPPPIMDMDMDRN